MATKKLGRGLGALVALPPAADDGTARVAEAIRGDLGPSVLALSGRTVEDFFRAIPRGDIVPNVPAGAAAEDEPAPPEAPALRFSQIRAPREDPPAAGPARAASPPLRLAGFARVGDEPVHAATETPVTPDALPPDAAGGDAAREVQHSLFDPPIEAPSLAAGVSDVAPETYAVAPPAEEPAPPLPQSEAPPAPVAEEPPVPEPAQEAPAADPEPAAPDVVLVDDVLLVDDAVAGGFLPDVELE